jgi:glyoxylase-like metal-dependent hydrolase (beta-lactamase superfamily II)
VQRWQVGEVSITRVPEPGFELIVPQADEARELVLANAGWLAPHFITPEGELRVGSSATVIESQGTTIVVDPWLAFDGADRLGRATRLLAALVEAGWSPDEVDVVIDSHIDGVGANTVLRGGEEAPAFPAARYLLAAEELEALDAGRRPGAEAFRLLADAGVLDHPLDGHAVTGEVTLEHVAGHAPGHVVVHVRSGRASAMVVGHLFLHPAQALSPDVADLDEDTPTASAVRRDLLRRCVAEGTLLVGPLFADPGAGHVVPQDDTWRLEA